MNSHTETVTGLNTPSRPASPDDSDLISPTPRRNPFLSPYGSTMPSAAASSTALEQHEAEKHARFFHSRRIRKGEVEHSWREAKKDPRQKWVTIIPILGLLAGFAIVGVLVWEGLSSVSNHVYCPVLDENFATLDPNIWTKEVQLGGFGNGEFEQATGTDENAFIRDGNLIIKPTLQDKSLMTGDFQTIDLFSNNACTSTVWSDCVAITNTTNSTFNIPPVKSARLTTRSSKSIKYGRVEVVAKLPAGDWLWPAIWMLPVNNTYGPWPASGEIDLMESRGNNYTYGQGGNNIMTSTLHWGPTSANDGYWMTSEKRNALHTTFAAKYHTFGLEWSEKYLFMYLDNRLAQVIYTKFNKPFWQRGNFPSASQNGSRLVDPWSQTGRDSTPFDQDFYLILNVAVGGTNGWFADGASGKPWVDASSTARRDFWNAQSQWYPTWTKPGHGEMQVKSVKMWQQAGYNGCKA